MYQAVESWINAEDNELPHTSTVGTFPPADLDFETKVLDYFITHQHPSWGRATKNHLFLFKCNDNCATPFLDSSNEDDTKDDLIFIAHGSYGATCRPTLWTIRAWQLQVELQPVDFYYNQLYPHLIKSLREAAKHVGSQPAQLAFVPNVEFGMNAVFRSLPFTKGDKVLIFNPTYDAVRYAIESLICERTGAELLILPLQFPLTDASAIVSTLTSYLETFEQAKDIKFAVFQHITSPTAILLPVKELVQVCHSRGIQVLIDGAHSLGSMQLELNNIGADFYVTNGHKWLCNARGCGILYIKEKSIREQIHPVVISWGKGNGHTSEFIWQGTIDYSPMLSFRISLRFFEWMGGPALMERNHNLVVAAGKMLSEVWQTDCLTPPDMCTSMCTVRVPESKKNADCNDSCQFSDLHDQLKKEYHIEVPVFTFNKARYMRLSAHMYNELEDYVKLGRAVVEIQGLDQEQAESVKRKIL